MSNKITIRQATQSDSSVVGGLVFELLKELFPDHYASLDCKSVEESAHKILSSDTRVWAFLAKSGECDYAGVLTLNECAAIYAGGFFGEISELYIKPKYRSRGVGELLISAATNFGRDRGWSNIEVGAPDVPRWQRSVDFYTRNGFEEVGPRLDLNIASNKGA